MKIPKPFRLMAWLLSFLVAMVMATSFVFGASNSTSTTNVVVSLPFGIPPEDTIFIAVLLGVLARTFLPYWAKYRAYIEQYNAAKTAGTAPPSFPFDKHFIYTAILGIVQSAVIAALLFQTIPPLPGFFAAFGYAYSSQDAINNVI